MHKWVFFILSGLAVLFLGACATSVDRGYMLERTLIVYEKNVRWGNFEAALGFRKPGSEASAHLPENADKIKVGGYDVVNQNMSADGMRMMQWVEISYFHHDSARVMKVIDKQTWEYDRDSGRWYIASALPEFK